jgi:hypothetical protein
VKGKGRLFLVGKTSSISSQCLVNAVTGQVLFFPPLLGRFGEVDKNPIPSAPVTG